VTTILSGETTAAFELAQRNRIRAFRLGGYVLIVAEGDLPTPGYEVDIQQSPLRIFPQQYNLLRRERRASGRTSSFPTPTARWSGSPPTSRG
jgi:hypothetical protein